MPSLCTADCTVAASATEHAELPSDSVTDKQRYLSSQSRVQDQLRQGRLDLRALQAKIAATDALIEDKDAFMGDLQRQAAAIEGQVCLQGSAKTICQQSCQTASSCSAFTAALPKGGPPIPGDLQRLAAALEGKVPN